MRFTCDTLFIRKPRRISWKWFIAFAIKCSRILNFLFLVKQIRCKTESSHKSEIPMFIIENEHGVWWCESVCEINRPTKYSNTFLNQYNSNACEYTSIQIVQFGRQTLFVLLYVKCILHVILMTFFSNKNIYWPNVQQVVNEYITNTNPNSKVLMYHFVLFTRIHANQVVNVY